MGEPTPVAVTGIRQPELPKIKCHFESCALSCIRRCPRTDCVTETAKTRLHWTTPVRNSKTRQSASTGHVS